MKRYLILIFMFLSVIDVQAQAPVGDTIYWDKDWRITTKADHEYFRTSELDTTAMPPTRLIRVADHYKNGDVQMDGYVLADDTTKLVGLYRWFTINGNLKEIVLIDHKKARPYFESKAPYLAQAPSCDSANIDIKMGFFKNGKVKYATYVRSGKGFDTCRCTYQCIYKEYNPFGKEIFETWQMKDGKFNGYYRLYNSNGRLWKEGDYLNDKKTDWKKVYNFDGSVKKEKGTAPKQ